MAAVAAQQTIVVTRAAVRRTAGAAPTKAVRLGGSSRVSSSSVALGPRRRGVKTTRASAQELAQVAFELDSETITVIIATVLGLGAGIGIPVFFVTQERDKERLEEIRELNRATLKATGEQMSEEEIIDLRPSRYLDRREFKDDD